MVNCIGTSKRHSEIEFHQSIEQIFKYGRKQIFCDKANVTCEY